MESTLTEPQQANDEEPKEDEPWWKQPAHQWAIGLFVTILIAALSSPLIMRWLDRDSTAASQLRECMELHELKTTPQKIVEEYNEEHRERFGEYRKTVFSSCSWPPTQITAGDGYSEIVAIFARGPGESESSGATYVDRIMATCSAVQFTYQISAQGYFGDLKPFVLARGSVAYAGDGTSTPWSGDWEPSETPYPESEEIVLLHDGKMGLASAKCIEPTN